MHPSPQFPCYLLAESRHQILKAAMLADGGASFVITSIIKYHLRSNIHFRSWDWSPPHAGPKLATFHDSPWAMYGYINKHYRQTWLQRLRLLREGGVLFTNSNMMVRSVPSGEVPTETPANI